MRRGDRTMLRPHALDLEGRGIADAEDRQVFVENLFVGESAEVAIEHLSRGAPVAFGRVVERGDTLPTRREVPCESHYQSSGRCSGCPLMTLSEEAQRLQKVALLAHLSLTVERVEEAPRALGYRMASKRVAFPTRAGLTLGSYIRGSHRWADMAHCLVDHPQIADAARLLVTEARALGLRAWTKREPKGLRAVWLKTDGRAVLVTLVAPPAFQAFATDLAARLPAHIGIAFSSQTEGSNNLRGNKPIVLREPSSLTLEGTEVGPLGFLQPNPEVAHQMYDVLLRDEHGNPLQGSLAFDLYAGAGFTTRRLATNFETVVPCESYAESAAALGVEPSDAVTFLANASSAPEFINANPPRKGLGANVCATLRRLGAPRVHIMACGPKGLARDLADLTPHYRLVELRAFDTLPQTPHVEVIAKLVLA
ncbi:MAG: hypothetical protein AAGE52_28730 [Myxococcota bacterium]